ncbi:hypothetical protein RJT34_17264 [Clitoria ternatea]|uniref:C-JID domain-containing protein n=1 Tax=Clitoria ternatea TaxID=43366 RepID=A0AAN9J8M8_CLITE
MTNLRFLQLHVPLGERSKTKYQCTLLTALSNELRYFEWNGFPFKSFPPNFHANFLVELRLPYSRVEELWQGEQDLGNLEAIDLRECKQLRKLPNLSKASKLKWVNFSGCESLCVIDSVLSTNTLVSLILDGCKKLKSLRSEKHLRFLENLSMDDCSSLKEFSMSSDLIESLDLRKTGVKILGPSIGRFRKLKRLNLKGLRLEKLADELCCVTSLEELKISNCGHVINKHKLQVICGASLRKLHLTDCYKLYELPPNINALSSLHELRLDGSGYSDASINYSSVEVCVPGSSAPKTFTYRTTESSITVQFPSHDSNLNVVGLIYCVVLSPTRHHSRIIKQHCVKIQHQCYRGNNGEEVSTWHREANVELNSDNVLMWYDTYRGGMIDELYYESVRFTFDVAGEHDVSIKGCGVHLLCYSQSNLVNFLRELEVPLDLKVWLDYYHHHGDADVNFKLYMALKYDNKLSELLQSDLDSRRHSISEAIHETGNKFTEESSRSGHCKLDMVKPKKMWLMATMVAAILVWAARYHAAARR